MVLNKQGDGQNQLHADKCDQLGLDRVHYTSYYIYCDAEGAFFERK